MKILFLAVSFFLSHSLYAADCASTITELKTLVGNADAPLHWKENTAKNPLTLNLTQGEGEIFLKLTSQNGHWADVSGVVCKTGVDSYVAKVSDLTWGPAAPRMARMARIKEIKLKMPYTNSLKVSVSFFSFQFSPI